jgi:sugar-specific transcriptional regulator TrmB
MNYTQKLAQIGFSKKESEIYLSLLKLKDCSITQIVQDTGIAKTTVYDTLTSMQRMGLVSMWRKNSVRYYSAESPNRLLKMQEEKLEKMKELVPELRLISEDGRTVPSAKLYTGKEGAKAVLQDVLDHSKMIKVKNISAYIRPDFIKYFPKASREWIKAREDLGIHFRILRPEFELGDSSEGYENNPLRETRVIKNQQDIKSSMYIYGNKTALFFMDNQKIYSLIIESEPFSNIFLSFFNMVWGNVAVGE